MPVLSPSDGSAQGADVSAGTSAPCLIRSGDGNFLLDKNGEAVWATYMEQAGNQSCFQGDGNRVLYSPAVGAVWSTGTDDNHHGGNGGRLLSLWTNGLLQVTDAWGHPLWNDGPFE